MPQKFLESKEYSLNVIQNLEEDAVDSYTLIFFTAVLISGVCFWSCAAGVLASLLLLS